jgi:hypothetical protein
MPIHRNISADIPAAGPMHISRSSPNKTLKTTPLKSSKKNENTMVSTSSRFGAVPKTVT